MRRLDQYSQGPPPGWRPQGQHAARAIETRAGSLGKCIIPRSPLNTVLMIPGAARDIAYSAPLVRRTAPAIVVTNI
jgi:hypothetical protein